MITAFLALIAGFIIGVIFSLFVLYCVGVAVEW